MAHLLLIDDDPDLLPDQVRQVFPAPPHRVEIAPTGSEGLGRARDVRPDVILLDLRLPDQSGLDVLKQLHQIDARIPVVLVTVVRSADAAIEAMRQGAYDYLLKPLDLQKLDRVIGEAVKVARLMREPAVVVGTPPAGGAHPLRREGPAAAVREVPDGLPDRGGQGVLRPAGGPGRRPGRRSLSRGRRPRRDLPGLVPQGGEGPGAEVTAGLWGDGS